jgi:ribosomal protein L39E
MLTGRLPYGAQIAKARTRSEQRKLRYASALDDTREIPAWIDAVLKKAVHPDPRQRYDELSEFAFDLRHPNKALLDASPAPLIERNPLLFWQALSLLLLLAILGLLFLHFGGRS